MNYEGDPGRASLGEEELAAVAGGAVRSDFPMIAEEFAWRNGCADCPHKNIFRPHAMCLEGYGELLQNYIDCNPISAHCKRRG